MALVQWLRIRTTGEFDPRLMKIGLRRLSLTGPADRSRLAGKNEAAMRNLSWFRSASASGLALQAQGDRSPSSLSAPGDRFAVASLCLDSRIPMEHRLQMAPGGSDSGLVPKAQQAAGRCRQRHLLPAPRDLSRRSGRFARQQLQRSELPLGRKTEAGCEWPWSFAPKGEKLCDRENRRALHRCCPITR
jgi:hypothetical protein